jgi:hypothetical protein
MRPCPAWVQSGPDGLEIRLPVHPDQRTPADRSGWSGSVDQLELARLHDGKIGGLLAFENAADEASGLAIRVMGIGAIAEESAGHHEMPKFVDRGDRVALGQGNDLVLPIGEECIGRHDEPADFQLGEARESRIEVVFARCFDDV